MDPISDALGRHYATTFTAHGPSSEGVDWGPDEKKLFLRYEKMLSIGSFTRVNRPTLLDVGCGYGGLYSYANKKGFDLEYTGIDLAKNMVDWATENMSSGAFVHGDVLEHPFDVQFDYVVCNGILTQKLDAPGLAMDQFAARLIRRMFALCRVGIAFNMMTTKVNFYSNNLYYRNPAEMLSWCLSELSPHLKLDHAYPLYEYTIYAYREPALS
jgi:SAM-dependent methyltransferase